MSRPTQPDLGSVSHTTRVDADRLATGETYAQTNPPHASPETHLARLAADSPATSEPIPAPIRGLPIARLDSSKSSSQAHYVVTTIDSRGRLADRSPLRVLRWPAGMPIRVSATSGTVIVFPQAAGPESVTSQGHLRLCPDIRRTSRIDAGDRLLMAAYRGRGLLIVLTMPVLDEMMQAYHLGLLGEASP
ncbi:hypothetical protein Prum_070040 [Phytohabitans rumicis]|uniref:SpoVT-AbrB domain-containing protein n=1 Tax=Phytohabitans rumicis TaxID=1076125 RepID=A0A6V8L7X8_9ACTN|nr:hypothetical protein Prum_070040 [Phytohabitans rumicis]